MKKYSWMILVSMIAFVYAEGDVSVGGAAPDFKLLDENSQAQSLSDYKGQDVVVYFYPKDDTPGCTKEACGIRDDFSIFKERKIKVLGISYDSVESHKKFKEKYELPFSFLSDSDKKVAGLYGSAGLFVAKRKTFLINKQGIIIKIYESVDVSTHSTDILNDFQEYYKKANP